MDEDYKHIIIGITGASGSVLAKNAIEYLAQHSEYRISVVITENAKKVFTYELETSFEDFLSGLQPTDALTIYNNGDMFAPIASGSVKVDCMIILPCSMASVAKMANGVGDTLLTRAADVMMKERRKLVIAPRESPLSTIHLKNMLTLSKAGAIIVPPVPAFYGRQNSMDDVYASMTGRILAAGGIENDLYIKWRQE